MGATNLGFDFRKLMCHNDDSSFELAYANEVTIDGKRSPQGRRLAYELNRSGLGLTGLSWVGSSLVCAGLGWVTLGLLRPELPHLGLLVAGVARSSGWPEGTAERKGKRKRKRKKERKGREKQKRKMKKVERKERRERKKKF